MTTTMTASVSDVLTDELLKRCHERAAGYDRENKFFQEDFEELRDAGYLKIAVPKELGGLGWNLAEVGAATRRLANYAPATAVGTNMIVFRTRVGSDVSRSS